MVYNDTKMNHYQTKRMCEKYTTSVRMPVALAKKLRWQADQEHRSINGIIVHLLAQALAAYPMPAEASHNFLVQRATVLLSSHLKILFQRTR